MEEVSNPGRTATSRAQYFAKSEEIVEAVRNALRKPLDYPDVALATVPGDRVTLALEYGLPLCVDVLTGALKALEEAGVDRARTSVVLSQEFADARALHEELAATLGSEGTLVVHDPEVDTEIALVGVTRAGEGVRLNRALFDADLIIPLGAARPRSDAPTEMLFPKLSDEASLARYRKSRTLETAASDTQRKEAAGLRKDFTEAGDLLGVGLAVQIVPGPDGSVADVVAGSPQTIQPIAQQRYHDVWAHPAAATHDLVVATIAGDGVQQSWENVARTVEVAEAFVRPGGAIAIRTELASPPGPAVRRLANVQDWAKLERSLVRQAWPDSWVGLVLSRALQRGTVYLQSRLPASRVESLGFAPISDDEELERLTKTHPAHVLLDDAQYLVVDGAEATPTFP